MDKPKNTLKEMEQLDTHEHSDHKEEQIIDVAQKLDQLTQRRQKYEQLKEQIEEAHKQGITQISTTDPDARALPKKMNIVEVSYNTVTSVEKKTNSSPILK